MIQRCMKRQSFIIFSIYICTLIDSAFFFISVFRPFSSLFLYTQHNFVRVARYCNFCSFRNEQLWCWYTQHETQVYFVLVYSLEIKQVIIEKTTHDCRGSVLHVVSHVVSHEQIEFFVQTYSPVVFHWRKFTVLYCTAYVYDDTVSSSSKHFLLDRKKQCFIVRRLSCLVCSLMCLELLMLDDKD